MNIKKITFAGIPECLELSDGKLELVVSTIWGPRVLYCSAPGGENFFKLFDGQIANPVPREWNSYGGHRLWHAPETRPRTYFPDNEAVPYRMEGDSLILDCPEEVCNGVKKTIKISISGGVAEIEQKITNSGRWEIKLAPWGLSVMAPGGKLILPLPDHQEYGDNTLLPALPIVLWRYTSMTDPRFKWGSRFIELSESAPGCDAPLKFGAWVEKGWVAYELNGKYFVKRFPAVNGAEYPDFGCNFESYTQPGMLEVEVLAPLRSLAPGESAVLTEMWEVYPEKPDFLM